MERILLVITILFLLTGCEPRLSWQEQQILNRVNMNAQFKNDLNYDFALCESFVKSSKYKFLDIKELSRVVYSTTYSGKKEYETSEQFFQRQQNEKEKLLKEVRKKTGSDYILHSVKRLATYYDADQAILFVDNHVVHMTNWLYPAEYIHLETDYISHNLGSEIKQNIFGTRVNVSKGIVHSLEVYLKVFSEKSLYYYNDRVSRFYPTHESVYWPSASPTEISVIPDKAKDLRNNLRMLIVADFQNSYKKSKGVDIINPTYTEPYDITASGEEIYLKPITICYYNQKTKEVYGIFGKNTNNIGEEQKLIHYIDDKFKYNY